MNTVRTSLYRAAWAVLAICALIATTLPASAVVIGSSVDNGDGTFTYSYQIDNSNGAFDIFAWSLEFGFATPDWNQLEQPTGDVSVPSNWIAFAADPANLISGLSGQDFLSFDPSGDVLIGTTLSGFSFTSSFAPGTVNYFEFSASGESLAGTVVGPAPVSTVPEGGPGIAVIAFTTLALFALGTKAKEQRV